MKKVSLMILVLLLFLNANLFANRATDVGAIIVGGEITYSIDTIESEYGKSTTNTLDVSPEMYYFAFSDLAFGGIINFIKFKEKYEHHGDIENDRYTTIYLNPGVKYFYDVNSSMSINTSINYQIWFWSSEGSSLEKFDSSLLTISCGLDYFITSHIAAEPYIRYRKEIFGDDFSDDLKSKSFDIGCKLAIFLFN